ncbi:MAG TPA: helicase-related protein [Opitutaceae bacterium]|nr:helicase-related protein [Opitutaceae bacterium]
MEAAQDDQWTHEEVVSSARQALVAELGIEGSELATAFLETPIGPRVRAGGVRAGLARFAAERVAAAGPGLRFGSYNEISDEVTLLLPATIDVRENLRLPVLSALPLKLSPFLTGLADRGAAAVAAELLARKSPGVAEAARRLRETPPAFVGWEKLSPKDVARAFEEQPPLLSDRKDLYQRIRLACTHAVERTLLDELARLNPGFLDYLQCFPVARSVRRKVIAWLGPTNSGKTHRAIAALSQARSGMYLGPLRLLALEQRDRLVELGCPCSLITGEERDETSATHSARTVEMTDFSQIFDVCVLDEMQLAFDRDRGWAWVAAYCGAAAETLIVTGPASAEPVIRRLAAVCGDTVEVNYLQRQGTLEFEGVLDWRRVPPRSAVIGFSRAMVLELKAMFESRGLRVSVIYGGLSPEVRRSEARRFRNGEADIVCATDAIGLGLNLPLDRVIFYEVDKFDGEIQRALMPSELLQIAGRAGRGPGSAGLVAAFSARDARRVANALAEPQRTPELELLPAAPTSMHIRAIADHLGVDRLTSILEFFETRLTFPGGTFFPEVQDDVFAAAELVDTLAPGLPVESRYALACAPIDLEDHLFRSTFAEWLEALEAGKKVNFPRRLDTSGGLEAVEEALKLITVYRWLALKFPEAFTDVAYVQELRRAATEQAQIILRSSWGKRGLVRRECAHCGRALLPSSPYRVCRECNAEGFA